MSKDFESVRSLAKEHPISDETSPEAKFFRGFKHKSEFGLSSAVFGIDDCASLPNDVVVCSGTRAEVFSGKTGLHLKSFTKSKEPVYSATLRSDGKLLALGNSIGQIMIFDFESKLLLRTLKGHSNAVRNIKFLPNKVNLISTSDDKTVRLWDVAAESEVACFQEHQDYVRALSINQGNPSLFLSGSYDVTVRLYDAQLEKCILSMDHGSPVEAVLLLGGGSMAASAGGNTLKLWDLVSGGTLLTSLTCHQKTISCLWASNDGRYLLTGSLDHQVKAICLSTYNILHSWSFATAVMSMAINGETMSRMFVGLSNGKLAVRTRKMTSSSAVKKPTLQLIPTASSSSAKVSAINRYLKKFQYRSAFDKTLQTNNPLEIAAVVDELYRRNGIQAAICGQTEAALSQLNLIIAKNLSDSRINSAMIILSNAVADVVAPSSIDPYFVTTFSRLRNKIIDELKFHNEALAVLGYIESLTAPAFAIATATLD